MSTTADTTTAAPSVKDLLELARADKAEQDRIARQRAVERASRFVDKARAAVAAVLGLQTADAHHLLTVIITNSPVGERARVEYEAPEGTLTFLYLPVRAGSFDFGWYQPERVQLLKRCPECGGDVLAHNPAYSATDRTSVGRLLMEQYDALHDPGHDERCSLAWTEDSDPSPPVATGPSRDLETSLARIADAVEEIAGRWPA